MNRQQRRAIAKNLKHKGVKNADELVKKYDDMQKINNADASERTPSQDIAEGQKVKLRIETIKSRASYTMLSEQYKKFVEENANTVFSAHIERPNMISFQENPKWLFWSGDLIKVEVFDNEH
jgi:hypothetical protein